MSELHSAVVTHPCGDGQSTGCDGLFKHCAELLEALEDDTELDEDDTELKAELLLLEELEEALLEGGDSSGL